MRVHCTVERAPQHMHVPRHVYEHVLNSSHLIYTSQSSEGVTLIFFSLSPVRSSTGDGAEVRLFAVRLDSRFKYRRFPCRHSSAFPSSPKLRQTLTWRRLHLSFFKLAESLTGGRMNVLARGLIHKSLSDVSDWEPRPIKGRRQGCGEKWEGTSME